MYAWHQLTQCLGEDGRSWTFQVGPATFRPCPYRGWSKVWAVHPQTELRQTVVRTVHHLAEVALEQGLVSYYRLLRWVALVHGLGRRTGGARSERLWVVTEASDPGLQYGQLAAWADWWQVRSGQSTVQARCRFGLK